MSNVHVIIGEDDYLVDETAKKTVGDGVGLETVDSLNSTNEELQLRDLREVDASFSTPPFLDPRKVTWWRNVRFLPGGGGKRESSGEAVKAALVKFAAKIAAAKLPENQHLVISGPKLLMTSVFAKTLKPVAEILTFAAGKPWEQARAAASRAVDEAAEMGLAFAPSVAEKFVARVGTDARSIRRELEKMRDYLGPGESAVTAAAVDEVTSQGVGVEPEIWAITDALGERDLARAIAAVGKFEAESGFAVLVTTVVEKFFRQLAELKAAAECGKTAAATEGMNPYVAKKNLGFASRWRLNELRRARFRFLKLRELAVSSAGGADELVVTEVVRAVRGL